MNSQVDPYFTDGCGRCPLGGTPACKVHTWPEELARLRMLLLHCGLTEELKWGVPCYTFQQHNVIILAAFKEYCALSFFKGALLQDTHSLLEKPGEHTQSGRIIKFTSARDIEALESTLEAYIYEAIEVEKADLKVDFNKSSELPIPEELQQKLDAIPDLKAAFEALTPGRQRGYLLYFTAPKQAKTREARIEKCMPRILQGMGMND